MIEQESCHIARFTTCPEKARYKKHFSFIGNKKNEMGRRNRIKTICGFGFKQGLQLLFLEKSYYSTRFLVF
jgi:hypothetical protein